MKVKIEAVVEVEEIPNSSFYKIPSPIDSGIHPANRADDGVLFVEKRLCTIIPKPIARGTLVYVANEESPGVGPRVAYYCEQSILTQSHWVTTYRGHTGEGYRKSHWGRYDIVRPVTPENLEAATGSG